MIPYIGDLSRRDAEVLRALAWSGDRILEFGSGASTQILAAYGRGIVESVETDPAWIEKTQRNLAKLAEQQTLCPVEFLAHNDFCVIDVKYDLIFIDGPDKFRRGDALKMWPTLTVNGAMCFHDTRRTKPHGDSLTSDVQNVCAVIERYSSEIDRVELNKQDSNITVIYKRKRLLYEDWNAVEGRTLEQIGLA